MKKTILLWIMALTIPIVLADYDGMMGYGMMGNYGYGGIIMGLLGIVWFALAAFVFSAIFWSTYKWIMKSNKTKRR